MKFAVDTRQSEKDHLEESTYFLCRVLKIIANKNPEHEFIFIFDRPYHIKHLFDKNVTAIVTGPQVNNILFRKIWYDIKIPALIRKYKADVFIAGNGICSLTTLLPQYLIINDLSFLPFPSLFKRAGLFIFNSQIKKYLQKADNIVTFSEFVKKDIVSLYAIKGEKITVIHNACKENYYPLCENEKEEIKKKYTGGKNYFLNAGTIHLQKNLIHLLKAFSVFKKRQKSDWKLVIAGSLDRNYKSFANNLKSYKYQDDVVLMVCSEEEIFKLTGAAYSFIYTTFWEGSGVQVLGPMNCLIPVVTSFNSSMQEIAGDAALYVNPNEHTDIADKMMLLYKDESLRNNLIEKGKIVAAQYSWEKTADLFWQWLLKACPASGNTLQ